MDDGSLNLALDDPQLFKYPVAWLWEPGFWVMTDKQADRLREYLQKGGFLDLQRLRAGAVGELRGAVTPHRSRARAGCGSIAQHPIFNVFFRVQDPEFPHPAVHHLFGLPAQYFGLFEENDPSRRLMAIANYNTNLAEYWQMAARASFRSIQGTKPSSSGSTTSSTR